LNFRSFTFSPFVPFPDFRQHIARENPESLMPQTVTHLFADGGMFQEVPDHPREQGEYARQKNERQGDPDILPDFRARLLDRVPELPGFRPVVV
jgi:hypothetical protein